MRCERHGFRSEWVRLVRDLDSLQSATVEQNGRITTRTHAEGEVGRVFQATGIGLPPNVVDAD